MKKYKNLLLEKAAPMRDSQHLQLKKEIFSGKVSLPSPTHTEFCSKIHNWFHNDTNNTLIGLENFHKEVCIGVTGFIDNLVMKYGIDNLQIFEHDYTYYKRLSPNKTWATVGNLIPKKPLLIAMPFPGLGNIHKEMNDILNESMKKQIPVFIDGSWMSSATDIEFNFNHPAIQSVAFSLSKGMSLDWNRIGIRYSKVLDSTDSITIANKFGTNNTVDMSIGMIYMTHFYQSYLWEKYGNLYHEACRAFLFKPTKCIHMVKHFNTGKPYGVRDVLLAAFNDSANNQ